MSLTVRELILDYKNGYTVVSGHTGLDNLITKPQVSRPGIELAGLFDFYECDRIQVMGSKEVAFFGWLNESDQEIRVDFLFQKRPPMFIFSLNAEIPDVFIRKGNDFSIPVVKVAKKTSALMSSLYQYLNSKMAERLSLHGTLVDISGVGVLIRGKSGLGKSETALELVRRGHQLVADDRVDVYQRELGIITGEAPEILREYLEIRGIGIVNVVKLFGAKAYKENKNIMLIVDLEHWDNTKDYDRLGLLDEKLLLFETSVPLIRIPVSEGRSIASLVEVAAMNQRLKHLGTNTAEEFVGIVDSKIKSKK